MPDPQWSDTGLPQPRLEAAQIRELMQCLPHRHAAAHGMVRRAGGNRDQFSSRLPGQQARPTPRNAQPFDFPDGATPPNADGDDWSLTVTNDEATADVPPETERTRPARTEVVMLSPETVEALLGPPSAANTLPSERQVPVPAEASGNEARRQENGTDRLPWQGLGWWRSGLLLGTLFLASLFAGLQLFGANFTVLFGPRQEPREVKAGAPAEAVELPPVAPLAPIDIVQLREDLLKSMEKIQQPAAPVAVPPVAAKAPVMAKALPAQPKAKASLYARVRQIVQENKTEETVRLGIGDIAYEDVPDDGSIMVGMEVTYAPFFTHNIIKSVRPIYQGPDGRRYDGPTCGTSTGVRERVVAKEGYAIGGAALRAGMGIDGMQLTFMAIGADGLNPEKQYLSKWLGGHGGANARTFVNDGRPIIGVAGMRSKNANSPAFCLCLVTTQAGALAAADGMRPVRPGPRPMR